MGTLNQNYRSESLFRLLKWNPLPKKKSCFFKGYIRIGHSNPLVCCSHLLHDAMENTPKIPRYVKRETSESPSYVNRLLAALFADEPWRMRIPCNHRLNGGLDRWSAVWSFSRKFPPVNFGCFGNCISNYMSESTLSESVIFLLNFIEVRVARYPKKL